MAIFLIEAQSGIDYLHLRNHLLLHRRRRSLQQVSACHICVFELREKMWNVSAKWLAKFWESIERLYYLTCSYLWSRLSRSRISDRAPAGHVRTWNLYVWRDPRSSRSYTWGKSTGRVDYTTDTCTFRLPEFGKKLDAQTDHLHRGDWSRMSTERSFHRDPTHFYRIQHKQHLAGGTNIHVHSGISYHGRSKPHSDHKWHPL